MYDTAHNTEVCSPHDTPPPLPVPYPYCPSIRFQSLVSIVDSSRLPYAISLLPSPFNLTSSFPVSRLPSPVSPLPSPVSPLRPLVSSPLPLLRPLSGPVHEFPDVQDWRLTQRHYLPDLSPSKIISSLHAIPSSLLKVNTVTGV